jgi:hypothetical protein
MQSVVGEIEASTPANWVELELLPSGKRIGDARGSVNGGSNPYLQMMPSKVTRAQGNEQCNYRVLICFLRRGWVRGLHRS